MTGKDFNLQSFFQRIVHPEALADKEQMSTVIGFFFFGALAFSEE